MLLIFRYPLPHPSTAIQRPKDQKSLIMNTRIAACGSPIGCLYRALEAPVIRDWLAQHMIKIRRWDKYRTEWGQGNKGREKRERDGAVAEGEE